MFLKGFWKVWELIGYIKRLHGSGFRVPFRSYVILHIGLVLRKRNYKGTIGKDEVK